MSFSKGSRDEQNAMFAYQDSLRREQMAFVDYASSQVDLSKPYPGQVETLDRMKKAYTSVLLLLCFTPLTKGVRPNTVLKAAGLYLSCMMFSDVFAEEAGHTLKETFLPCVKERVHRDEMIGFSDDESDWIAQRKRVEESDAAQRIVWTPDSAAIAQLAYWKQMYEQAESDGDRLAELQELYDAKSEALYFDAGQDGVSRGSIELQALRIAGMLEQKDAESACCFAAFRKQLEYIQFRRGVERSVRLPDAVVARDVSLSL